MTGLLVLLVLLPWSIRRQMQPHEVTQQGLVKLPLIFGAIGLLGLGTRGIPGGADAVAYLALSAVVSIGFGIWRGAKLRVWREDDRFIAQGTRLTLTLWVALIVVKIAMGTAASALDIFPGEHTGEIFLFLAVSFAAQDVVVARRTIWRQPGPAPSTA